MSFDPLDAFTGETSNCCGARVMIGGICAACKEHCDTEQNDEESTLRQESANAKYDAKMAELDRLDRKGPRT